MNINSSNDGKCGYIAMFNGKKANVWADSSHQAQQRAIEHFKPAKSKRHMVHVYIATNEGTEVVHSTASV